MKRMMVLLAGLLLAAQAHALVPHDDASRHDGLRSALAQALDVPAGDTEDDAAENTNPGNETPADSAGEQRQRIQARMTDIEDAIAALKKLVCAPSSAPTAPAAAASDCVAARGGR